MPIFKISINFDHDTKSLMIGKLLSIGAITMSGINLAFSIVSSSELCNS